MVFRVIFVGFSFKNVYVAPSKKSPIIHYIQVFNQIPHVCIRGLLACSDCSKLRVVYSRYNLSGKGIRTVNHELDVLESKGEFKCGTDITKIFEKENKLKTKVVTVDQRLS